MKALTVVKSLLLAVLFASLSACKLFVMSGGGGSVTGSAGNSCGMNSVCEVEITDTSYSESFTAVPASGYEFVRWEENDGYWCGNLTNPVCTLSLTGFAGNPSVEALVASDQAYAIRPIFKPVGGYLGMTSSSYDGSSTLRDGTAACQSEYGSQAVVCSVEQIIDSPRLVDITPPVDGMWLRRWENGLSGYWCTAPVDPELPLERGIALNNNFQVTSYYCGTSRPIACCR